MESSASPSGASSHATQTGRPSLWTDSDQRKLGRLYVYTALPLKKILDVIRASSPTSGPGKDSANKKLNAMLDKEPRWLRPRTDTDVERRMTALAHSPTRSVKRELPSPGDMQQHYDQSPISPADYNNHNPWHMTPSNGFVPPSQAAPYDYDPNLLRIHPPDTNYQALSYSPETPAHFTNQIVAEPVSEPHPPPTGLPHRFSNFYRRGTTMTTSTERTTTELRRALSGYSSNFVTHVRRVVKRYTMPVQPGQNNSPVAEHSDSASGSKRDSWIHDEHAPPERTVAPYLPGDYLLMDALLQRQGHCPEGSPEHQTRNCLCRAALEIRGTVWVDENGGPSPLALSLMQKDVATPADFNTCDVFENFLMHMLVAHDVDHFYILRLVSSNVNCRQRNVAGQTFLHLLQPSWLNDPISRLGPLTTLIQSFRHDMSFLLARDCYGRTFIHVLLSKIQDATPLNQLLQSLDFTLLRDAFGSVPTYEPNVLHVKPLRRAITSVMSEDEPMSSYDQPALPAVDLDLVSTHTRLIEMVKRAQEEPHIEDAHGRNGLHCLAAAILSNVSLLRQAGMENKPDKSNQPAQGDAASGKKRKRETGLKHTDSSKERLSLRETIANNLTVAGVNVNHYDADGNTVLMAFVAQLPEDDDYKVPVEILKLLIDRGADVNARNRRGETALHIAVRRGRKLAMRTLVEKGANVHVRDAAGRGLLDVADEMARCSNANKPYMHSEACRAFLSGHHAVQDPSILQEWGLADS